MAPVELCDSLLGPDFRRPSTSLLAAMLGINTRSLQRNLKAEGTSYRQVLEDARKRTAIKDLSEGARIIDTALKLGYDHPQNFTATFDKWSGCSPSNLREELSTYRRIGRWDRSIVSPSRQA